jgi:CRISPR-associated protein (TIGR03984 family)
MNNSSKSAIVTPLKIASADLSDQNSLKRWIEEQREKYDLQYLIAHAEDGVIWGRFQESELVTAESLWVKFPIPSLQPISLQQCRIFGKDAEVMLWRQDRGWQARVIQEAQEAHCIIEEQMLWGDTVEKVDNGFTLLTDGQQGLRHALPITGIRENQSRTEPSQKQAKRHTRLHVKHYIDYDNAGIALIYYSRLFDLTTS